MCDVMYIYHRCRILLEHPVVHMLQPAYSV